MRKCSRLLLSVVTMTLICGVSGLPQSPPTGPAELPVRVEVVLARDEQGVKRSAPYSLSATSSGIASALILGTEVWTATGSPQQLGTQIRAAVRAIDDGRFSVELVLNLKTLSPAGQLVKFASTNTVTSKDGETMRYTATDKDSGVTYDVAVTVTVVK